MKLVLCPSDYMVPLAIFYTIDSGLLSRRPVYDDFVEGAKEGTRTVASITPTLIGLMVVVGVLRASDSLDVLAAFLGQWTGRIGFPAEPVPVTLVKVLPSSTATGLALDIFKQLGTDSYYELITSIMLSYTETIFYTMSAYFVTTRAKGTHYTLADALIAASSGVIASVILADIIAGK